MASTNKTTNYELSQFVGTDKPAWLGDYNTDMGKIDTQMKANADTATGADGKADANATAIGTLSNLTTEAKTNLVSAINEVQGEVTTAQNTANSANTTANTASTNIAKFNLTNRSNLTPTVNLGTLGDLTNVQFATDTTNSVFKVYGRIQITNLTNVSGTITLSLGNTSLRPTTAYEINTGAILVSTNLSEIVSAVGSRNIKVDTNGDISVVVPAGSSLSTISGNTSTINIYISPCLYFNSDFGDQ